MQFLDNRIASYAVASLPHKLAKKLAKKARNLANAGFYYAPTQSQRDRCTCVFCASSINNIESTDDILLLHSAANPSCPMVIIGESTADSFGEETIWSKTILNARIRTFKDWWPLSDDPSVSRMAEAGFRYNADQGNQDAVICCYCQLELDNWESGDDPRTEHIKRKPDCIFFGQPAPVGESREEPDKILPSISDCESTIGAKDYMINGVKQTVDDQAKQAKSKGGRRLVKKSTAMLSNPCQNSTESAPDESMNSIVLNEDSRPTRQRRTAADKVISYAPPTRTRRKKENAGDTTLYDETSISMEAPNTVVRSANAQKILENDSSMDVNTYMNSMISDVDRSMATGEDNSTQVPRKRGQNKAAIVSKDSTDILNESSMPAFQAVPKRGRKKAKIVVASVGIVAESNATVENILAALDELPVGHIGATGTSAKAKKLPTKRIRKKASSTATSTRSTRQRHADTSLSEADSESEISSTELTLDLSPQHEIDMDGHSKLDEKFESTFTAKYAVDKGSMKDLYISSISVDPLNMTSLENANMPAIDTNSHPMELNDVLAADKTIVIPNDSDPTTIKILRSRDVAQESPVGKENSKRALVENVMTEFADNNTDAVLIKVGKKTTKAKQRTTRKKETGRIKKTAQVLLADNIIQENVPVVSKVTNGELELFADDKNLFEDELVDTSLLLDTSSECYFDAASFTGGASWLHEESCTLDIEKPAISQQAYGDFIEETLKDLVDLDALPIVSDLVQIIMNSDVGQRTHEDAQGTEEVYQGYLKVMKDYMRREHEKMAHALNARVKACEKFLIQ